MREGHWNSSGGPLWNRFGKDQEEVQEILVQRRRKGRGANGWKGKSQPWATTFEGRVHIMNWMTLYKIESCMHDKIEAH